MDKRGGSGQRTRFVSSIDIEAFFHSVRKACSRRAWSMGVALTRGDSISMEREDDEEVVMRVVVPRRPAPLVVALYPADEEWDCECPSREDPCHHVAGATIAYKESMKSGQAIAASTRPKLVVEYHLFAEPTGMSIERWTRTGDNDAVPLETTLAALATAESANADVSIEDIDRRVERITGTKRRAPLRGPLIDRIFAVLRNHPRVKLDGRTVTSSGEPLKPLGTVRDEGDSIAFVIAADPSLARVIVPGVGQTSTELRPLAEVELAGHRWERLPIVRRFPKNKWAELVSETIPLMATRVTIDVRSKQLPKLVNAGAPRIELGVQFDRGRVSLDPTLVYGRPPIGRIETGNLVYLGGGVPKRDRLAERNLLTRLRDELNLVPGRRVDVAGRDAFALIEKLHGWNEASDHQHERFDVEIVSTPLRPQLHLQGGGFDLRFETDDEGKTRSADPMAVLDAWRSGFGVVPLLEGGFAPLPHDWLEANGHRLLLLLSARDKGEVPNQLLPDLAALADALDAPPPPQLERLMPLVSDSAEVPEAPRPDDLDATLRHYQEVGVDWLSFLRNAELGGILADDMGLGKTLQAICVLGTPTLVVCPTSVLHNWASEIARFRPSLSVCVYHGPKRAIDEDADVVLTTYALLRRDAAKLDRQWDTVVLDEAQAIKNPQSQSARAAFGLKAKFRLSLSGTPLENRLEELWSQLHFTNPGVLGGRQAFEQRYAKPIGEGDEARAAELRARLRPFVLRRVKEEVAPELPPRTEMRLYAELAEPERAVYDAVRAATQKDMVERLAGSGGVMAALEALLRLRQAACHSSLVPGQHAETSSKLDTLVDALDQVVVEGHRALVFSQWTSFLDLVEARLGKEGIGSLRLDGSTTNRQGMVDRFQADDGPPVFLISLKAGGTGLNLTAADHVFFLDPWWNPAVEQQAADRAHRIGQDKPVMIYRIVAKDTVEERILDLQERKRALAAATLDGTGSARALTKDDLLALLA